MSVYEDIKKALQDFISPELRALDGRLDGFELLTAERFKRLEEKIDAHHREVMSALNLDKRMAIIEDRQNRTEAH